MVFRKNAAKLASQRITGTDWAVRKEERTCLRNRLRMEPSAASLGSVVPVSFWRRSSHDLVERASNRMIE
jgi:hypothetical protein